MFVVYFGFASLDCRSMCLSVFLFHDIPSTCYYFEVIVVCNFYFIRLVVYVRLTISFRFFFSLSCISITLLILQLVDSF